MKRTALFLAAIFTFGCVFAQNVAKNEVKALKAFLAQPAAKGGTNAEALRITNLNDPSAWEGVKVGIFRK